MTRRLKRLLPPLLAFACGAAAMLLFLSPAHADPVIAVTPTGLELSWQAWLMVGLAAAGGALKILDVLIAGLRWLAPRTETKLDDKAADDLQAVHDKLDSVLKVVGGLVPAAGVPTSVAPPAPGPMLVKTPGSGTAAMLAVLLLGAGLAVTPAGCGGSQASRATTISSLDTGLHSAIAGLRTYEHDQAEAIKNSATSFEQGKAALAALRAKTNPAWHALTDALVALDAANTINDDPSIKTATAALSTAVALVTALTGGTP